MHARWAREVRDGFIRIWIPQVASRLMMRRYAVLLRLLGAQSLEQQRANQRNPAQSSSEANPMWPVDGVRNGVKMMTQTKRVLAAAVIGIATIGALSQASAQSVPHRHSSRQGHIERSYPFNQDDSQYPDYSSTGSGYSRGGCSGSPAEC
jgi:hypothetical protein